VVLPGDLQSPWTVRALLLLLLLLLLCCCAVERAQEEGLSAAFEPAGVVLNETMRQEEFGQ